MALNSLVDLAGLFQRTAITIGWGWLTLLDVHLLRDPSEMRRRPLAQSRQREAWPG